MDFREAAARIEDHMIVHHMAEYPHEAKITEALGMAVELLRAADRVNKRVVVDDVDWDEVPHPGGFH